MNKKHFGEFTAVLMLAAGLYACKARKPFPDNEPAVIMEDEAAPVNGKSRMTPAIPLSRQKVWEEKLGIILPSAPNTQLLDICVEWLGVPYQYGECTKRGTDCSGFTHMIYQEVYGINLKRSSADMYSQAQHIENDSVRMGDLVFFQIQSTRISHVGVYLNSGKFIHASTSKGVMVSSLDEPYYRKYFRGYGRAF